ncbi:MAG TPA: sigma-70 family RNA polymerase sigma factor [Polyangiales bacterium]|nr:sigma-70 family RNA polymerase sigma factor [Polyangiales bacterium]
MHSTYFARDLSALQRAAQDSAPLSQEEEQALGRAARSGDASAFDRLVRAHLRLVLAMAAEHRRFGVSQSDLVSEGLLALVSAARRFDPDRGVRLAVYAAHWIRAFLRRHALKTRRIVGPPTTRVGRVLLANLGRVERDLTQALGAAPPPEVLAERLGVSVAQIAEAQAALRGQDAEIGPSERHDSVEPVSTDPSPEAAAAEAELRSRTDRLLRDSLASLGARERDIVRSRHLQDDPPTLDQLARDLSISRERVRQLEARGCQQLRAAVQREARVLQALSA